MPGVFVPCWVTLSRYLAGRPPGAAPPHPDPPACAHVCGTFRHSIPPPQSEKNPYPPESAATPGRTCSLFHEMSTSAGVGGCQTCQNCQNCQNVRISPRQRHSVSCETQHLWLTDGVCSSKCRGNTRPPTQDVVWCRASTGCVTHPGFSEGRLARSSKAAAASACPTRFPSSAWSRLSLDRIGAVSSPGEDSIR
jgi:hypothetical protein